METLMWAYLLLVLYPVEVSTFNYGKERDNQHNWTVCGDNLCKCNEINQAFCLNQGHKLNYIPRFERNITYLNFTGNYLPHIDNHTFTNITNFKLNYLHLQTNSIRNCTRNAFNGLTFLRTLSIRNSTISKTGLMQCLSGVTKDLQTLDLSYIHYYSPLNLDLDESMNNSKIKTLYIRNIDMTKYNHSKLSTLKHLQSITILKSYIKTVTFDYSSSLRTLNFSYNKLSEFPKFCVHENAYFTNLEELRLDHNNIPSVHPEQLACMKSLATFSINNNLIFYIENNTFSNLPNLNVVSIVYNSKGMCLDEFAFNSSSLKKLYIYDDDLYFDKDHKCNSLDAFKYCSQLEILRVSSNHFEFTTNPMFDELFSNLVNVKSLSLTRCRLTFLPSFIPKYLYKLEKLWLHNNNIKDIPEGYFNNFNHLQNIQLNSNKITTVKQITFSLQCLQQLKYIDLSGNPFSCSCELLWFINCLKTSSISNVFFHFPTEYICDSPPPFKGKQLVQVRLSERTCAITKQVRVIIISTSAGILLLLLTISAVYRYRWNLRYILYMARFQHIRHQRLLNGGGDYKYDVYLSSSDTDFDDVIYDVLVPRLEENMGLRLYIPQRDGQGNKIDQIISNMDASRKVILFLSDKYVEDGYCEFEASVAYNKYINEKRDLMIVVVLRELGALNVTKTIHKILSVDKYIKWGWDDESVELFWLKITAAINNMDDLIP
ncbi:toll-like receptor 2 type-2 [Patella vulgata]|uniref:toll-like receptor 2 type-2 n=1 Tax=Patella vulgata TaxID=6465 RepID=UPI0021809311|nr:toll-like receptor 2 type-2 [Patella vulgata]